MKIFVLLPAYNEESSLHQLLPKIDEAMKENGYDYGIIVGNDGSSDKTAEILAEYEKKLPLTVITHRYNRGLGETSRDLFEAAVDLASPYDVIVRMDCDDTHEPQFIKRMVEKLDEGFDVVIASRFQKGGGQKGVSGYRAFISMGANMFMKTMFRVHGVKEFSCGFRAYRAGFIQKAVKIYGNSFIQLKGLGFTCTLEKLVKLNMLGARFGEVPFMLRYDQKMSDSKMVGSITTLGYLIMALLYHWPWGGWKSSWKPVIESYDSNPASAHLPETRGITDPF